MIDLTAFEAYLGDELEARPNTVRGYVGDMRLFAAWFERVNGQPLTPARLTRQDAKEYRQHLDGQGAAPATINRRLAALQVWAAWAVETGRLNANPVAGIRGKKEQPLSPRWLDKQDQGRTAPPFHPMSRIF